MEASKNNYVINEKDNRHILRGNVYFSTYLHTSLLLNQLLSQFVSDPSIFITLLLLYLFFQNVCTFSSCNGSINDDDAELGMHYLIHV
jgi:hypothetical protein